MVPDRASHERGQKIPAEASRLGQPLVLQLVRAIPRLDDGRPSDRPADDRIVRGNRLSHVVLRQRRELVNVIVEPNDFERFDP